jgi:hypothetical protein
LSSSEPGQRTGYTDLGYGLGELVGCNCCFVHLWQVSVTRLIKFDKTPFDVIYIVRGAQIVQNFVEPPQNSRLLGGEIKQIPY